MNLHDPAAWLGLLLIIGILGSYAIWWAGEREKAREATEDAFWDEAMQPNRHGDHVAHTPPDALEERPLLPEDYQ